MVDRVFRAFLELAVGLWMARHLGPAEFGNLSFALASIALLVPLATAGIQGVLVRELVAHPDEVGEILGSATLLRFAGSAAVVTMVFAGSALAAGSNPERWQLVQIVALGVLFQTFEVVDLYLQAHSRMRASAIARSVAATLTSLGRIVLILAAAGVAAFAWTFAVETALWAAILLAGYQVRGGSVLAWRWSRHHAMRLLHSSWPLILSGIGAVLNLRIDQVMLGAMVAPQELGIYSAAARLSEAVYFVPVVLTTAAFPGIVRVRTEDLGTYWARLEDLSRIMVGLALVTIAVGIVLGPFVIHALLGEAFAGSGVIFRIHVTACLFIFPGALLSRWLIAEDLTRFSITRHASGAAVNVSLNFALIPLFGGVGSAIATVISYATASHFAFYLSAQTRPAARMVTRALLWTPRDEKEERS